ncbi:MAG: hypothetical protein Kow00104_19650 [Rhodothalassiaceae bacterium]
MSEKEERVIDAEFSEAPAAPLRRLLPLSLILLLLAFIGGLFAMPHFETGLRRLGLIDPPPPAAPDPAAGTGVDEAIARAVAPLASRITALEAALATGEEANAAEHRRLDAAIAAITAQRAEMPAIPDGEATGLLSARIAALEAAMARLAAGEDKAAPPAFAERLSALEAAVAARQDDDKGDTLAVLILALDRRLLAGAPYRAELARLVDALAALPDPPEGTAMALRQLHIHADAGIPTNAELMADFGAAAARMQRAEPSGAGEGFLDRLGRSLRSLVTIRRLDSTEGPEAILNRAGEALASGDVAAALVALSELPPEMLSAGADWISAAEIHRDTLAALERIVAGLGEQERP